MAVPWPEIAAHRERLLKVARRRVPTREDAEDVVHEAMLRCAEFEELDEARLGQFLTAVTVRLCADVYRTADRGARALRRLEAEDVPGPEVAAVAAAEAAELRALLATLPERQRHVLVDRAEGLSVTQISSRHALTYKATESALSRARATMRVALASAVGVVVAAFAAVRRRPAAALALPVVAVAFVASVHSAPPAPAAAPPPAPRPPAPAGTAPLLAVREPVPAPAARAARRAAAPVARPARRTARKPAASPYEKVFEYQPPVPGAPRIVVEDDGETVPQMVDRCLHADHYSVSINPRPQGQQAVVDPYCHPEQA
ncbi:MAG TPA: sigma-70 family RNA polymerase sigma factor [Mycobacteriales bacterium]|jgi:RNA polymerase sigma-70 factor (ECF subfamily)